jgi:Putative prokaryotic signal transducing protein
VGGPEINPEKLRQHFDELSDDALLETKREDLTDFARQYYDAEVTRRHLNLGSNDVEKEPDEIRDELAPVATFLSPAEADLAAALLRSAGIPAQLENEHSYQWTGAGGLRVSVPASLVQQAQEILETQVSDEELIAEADAAEPVDPDAGPAEG